MSGLPDNMPPEKKWWQGVTGVLNLFLVIAIVFFFAVYVIDQRHHLAELFSLSPRAILFLFLFTFGIIVSSGAINYFLYRRIDCPVTLFEGIALAVVNILGNLLPFSGGLIGKGMYLKQRHRLSYDRYLSATVALYFLFMAANGIAGLLALFFLGLTGAWPSVYLFLGFSGLCLSVLVFILPLARLIPRRWRYPLRSARLGWGFITNSPAAVGLIIVLKLAGTGFIAGRLWILFAVFSQDIGFAPCVVFAAGAMLTRLVSITPGALGVREAIVGGLSAALGFPFGLAVIVTVMDRLVGILGAGMMAAVFLPRRKGKVENHSVGVK